MALTGNTLNQLSEDEHRKKNVGAKAVVVYGYNSDTDTYVPIEVDAEGKQNTTSATRVATDSGDSNLTYIGKAPVGSATSGAVWQIQRIDETTGTVITYADGDAEYNNIWDNRESLSYS